MTIRLNGQTSGYVELEAPATAGSNTLVLPDGNGTSGQYLQTNGSGALSWQTVTTSDWTEATATSTSGSTVEFTGLPSDVKEITVVWSEISSVTSSPLGFRLGTGATPSYATSGYRSFEVYFGSSTSSVLTTTDRFRFTTLSNTNTHLYYGQVTLRNPTGNTWITHGETWTTSYANIKQVSGYLDLGNTLTAIQFLWSTGDFDSGNWKIMYRR